MTTYVIKTSAGLGSPAYTDEKAPFGAQWNSVNGEPGKVPEGTEVVFTGKNNANKPPYSQIKILDGMFVNSLVWVKSTHVVEETAPVEPPAPSGDGEWFEKLEEIHEFGKPDRVKLRKI